MLRAADRLTVPQIFVGTFHVGGADALEELLDGGDAVINELMKERAGDALPGELLPPSYPPKEKQVAAERTEDLICIGETCFTYQQLSDVLSPPPSLQKQGLSIKMHGKHRASFTGKDLIDFLMKTFDSLQSRSEAVQVANSLHKSRFFDHVRHSHSFIDSDEMVYRLQKDAELMILNQTRWWNDRVDDPMVTLSACKSALSGIVDRHRKDGLVDYLGVSSDPEFSAFEEMVCEFQAIRMQDMAFDVRTAFCINIYNMMVLHAYARAGIPRTSFQRLAFFDHIKYNIGGSLFSFNDLENGILRGNRSPPYHLSKPFKSKNDPRLACALPRGEARIHFALNCGARSCPPVKDYTAEAIEDELRVVALAFMEQDENCSVDEASKTLRLSKILSWYSADFGKTKAEKAKTVRQWLRGEKARTLDRIIQQAGIGSIKIKYFPYDWSTDASNARNYQDPAPVKCAIL